MIIINYLHRVSHSLNTSLKKKFFPKHTIITFHKIQYFGADRKPEDLRIKDFHPETFKYENASPIISIN